MPPKKKPSMFQPRKAAAATTTKEEPAEETDADTLTVLQRNRLVMKMAEDEARAVAVAEQRSPSSSSSARSRKDRGGGEEKPVKPDTAAAAPPPAVAHARVSSASASTTAFAGGASGPATAPAPSTAAARRAAAETVVDVSGYPEEAARLPSNTAQGLAGCGAGRDPAFGTVYPPTPLDRRPRGAAEDAPPAVQDGTAFLREEEEERRRIFADNKAFYERYMAPLEAGHAPPGLEQQQQQPGAPLVWLQLPRFESPSSPFALGNLTPGKVGELKVLRSGRMVLEIRGVYYDVAVPGEDATEDMCATAVATPSSANAQPKCFELGPIERKFLCTPTIES